MSYESAGEKCFLAPEQAAVFADEDSPACLARAFDAAASYLGNQDAVQNAFATGSGVSWGDSAGAMTHIRESLRPNGSRMVVEPQAGETRLREVMVDGGGFTHFNRVAESPFNMVIELRP